MTNMSTKTFIIHDNKVIDKEGNIILTEPFHPGEFLKEEVEARDILKKDFALLVGINRSHMFDIFKGEKDIQILLALKLEELWGISAEYWLKMQLEYNIYKARLKQSKS